jgi:hypothetical protein
MLKYLCILALLANVRKVGFVNGMPPGLAKKRMVANCQPASNPIGNEKFEHGPHPEAGGPPGRMH